MAEYEQSYPSPAQLRRLVMVGAASNRERSILRAHSKRPKYYYGLDKHIVEQETADDEATLALQHSMGMRVVQRYFEEIQQTGWLLEYSSSYHTNISIGNLSATTKYMFEWTSDQTRLSQRLSHFALNGEKLSQSPDIETILDRQLFYIPEDAVEINESEYSFSQVTAEDCTVLTDEIGAYYERLKQLAKQ